MQIDVHIARDVADECVFLVLHRETSGLDAKCRVTAPLRERPVGMAIALHGSRPDHPGRSRRQKSPPRTWVARLGAIHVQCKAGIVDDVREVQLAAGQGGRDRGDARLFHSEARHPKTRDLGVHGCELTLNTELRTNRRLEGQPAGLDLAVLGVHPHARPVRQDSVVHNQMCLEGGFPSFEPDNPMRLEQTEGAGDHRTAL